MTVKDCVKLHLKIMIGEVLDSHTTITFLWHYYISHTIYAVGVTVKYTEFFLFVYVFYRSTQTGWSAGTDFVHTILVIYHKLPKITTLN